MRKARAVGVEPTSTGAIRLFVPRTLQPTYLPTIRLFCKGAFSSQGIDLLFC